MSKELGLVHVANCLRKALPSGSGVDVIEVNHEETFSGVFNLPKRVSASDMNGMIKIYIVRKIMNPYPLKRLTGRPALANQSKRITLRKN